MTEIPHMANPEPESHAKIRRQGMTEMSQMVKVRKTEQHSPTLKSIYLDYGAEFLPGQFYMFWLPGVDEKPFVFSGRGKKSAITVRCRGQFTKKLFGLKAGEMVGVRGPYGNGFESKGVRKACIVAGGIGAAPTVTLAEMLKEKKADITIILSARSRQELLFRERFKKTGKLYITTDDGSTGEKCLCTDALHKILGKEKFDAVYGCGPEVMLAKLFEICQNAGIECQLSLERYMKCGFGVCGQCSIDGWLVCRDGPVFSSKQLRSMGEFGKFAYAKSGKRVSLGEYCSGKCGK